MPSLQEDKQALDYMAENLNDPRVPEVAQKLGLGPQDLQAWKWTKDNPADMRSVKVRNHIFDVIAETRPTAVDEQGGEIKGGIPVDRLAVKNLLDGSPDAQKAYFEKKGYKTRTSTQGDLQVKAPGETYYKAIDPEGIDRWDAADVLFDVGAGIATGANAAKMGGGPVGMAYGSLIGGITGAGTEAGKQFIAKTAGMREGYDAGEIAKQGLIGAAVPAVLDAGGYLLKQTGKGIGKAVTKLTGSGLKPNAAAIQEASEAIGAKATPGQLFEGEVVKKLEDAQRQSAGMIGGIGLRKQIEKNIKAAKDAADDVVGDAVGKTQREFGEEIGEKLKASVAERLQPAIEIYEKYEKKFANIPLKDASKDITERASQILDESGNPIVVALTPRAGQDIGPLGKAFADVKQEFRYNPAARAKIGEFEGMLTTVKNLDDLKSLRTAVNRAKSNPDPEVRMAVRELSSKLTDARSQILETFAEKSGGSADDIIQEIRAADKIYAKTISQIENVTQKDIKTGSPKIVVDEFLKKTPEIARINKIIKANDPTRLQKIKEEFPEVFEAARRAKISDIAEKIQPGEEVNPKKLAKIIAALPPETKTLLFGHDAAKKADFLKTYLDSLPGKLVGPSGTPEGMRWFKLGTYIDQLASLKRGAQLHFMTAAPLGKDIFTTMGRVAETGVAKGGTTAAANAGLLLPQRRKEGE